MIHYFESEKSKEKLVVQKSSDKLKVSISVHERQYAGVHLSKESAEQLKESIEHFLNELEE